MIHPVPANELMSQIDSVTPRTSSPTLIAFQWCWGWRWRAWRRRRRHQDWIEIFIVDWCWCCCCWENWCRQRNHHGNTSLDAGGAHWKWYGLAIALILILIMIFSFQLLVRTGALSVMSILAILIQNRFFLAVKDIRSVAAMIAITAYRIINIHRISIDADFTVILVRDHGGVVNQWNMDSSDSFLLWCCLSPFTLWCRVSCLIEIHFFLSKKDSRQCVTFFYGNPSNTWKRRKDRKAKEDKVLCAVRRSKFQILRSLQYCKKLRWCVANHDAFLFFNSTSLLSHSQSFTWIPKPEGKEPWFIPLQTGRRFCFVQEFHVVQSSAAKLPLEIFRLAQISLFPNARSRKQDRG